MCHKILHLVLCILSILLLWLKTTTSTSVNHRLVPAATHYKCIDKERDALLDFKSHIQDLDSLLSTWTIEKEENYECCNWSGVTCNNQTGHVTELHLSSYSLGGKISHSLVNLSYLSYLDLSENSFNGTIPIFIGSMTQLGYLDLSFSSFKGTIPTSVGSLTKLTRLDLSGNFLTGTIPLIIGSMTQLNYLDLSDNSFSGTIPRTVGSMTKLRYFDLSRNYLEGTIPTSIGFLTKLTHLALSDNYLLNGTCIPLELGNLTNLQELALGHLTNCTVENIDWLSHMSDLNYLMMDGTSLAKANKWVNVILGLQKLSFLSLSGCNLSQVMHSYSSSFVNSSSSSINNLYLDDNNLNSSMYHWLLPLTSNKLRYLDLSKNMLDGKSLGYLCSLTNLEFSYNSAVVNLSDLLNNWSGCTSVALQTLEALYSRFTGVPSEAHMPNLSNVYYIDLSSCNLGPLFPKWIQSLKNLTRLNIANNNISDTIPTEFWNIWPSQLVYLNLSANNIRGEVRDLVSNFSPNDYSVIDLSYNNFYGHIPKVPSILASLDLSRNKFHGGISFLCHISVEFLRYLDLSHNSFTGKLPDCLWHFKELKVLNLGSNNLSGRLPASASVDSLIRLEVLSLYNNNLFGELPLSLKSCTMLTFLDLGANKFTGNVPLWIGESLSRLYVLNLASNKLLGHIPLQLCQLANLQILDLSMNNLNGTIPTCLNNLITMVQEEALHKQNIHGVTITAPLGQINSHQLYSSLLKSIPLLIYVDNAMIHWQGIIREFSTNIVFLKIIDLSQNKLTGQIPYEITDLHGLVSLNLSNNALDGKIPWTIAKMRNLLALDLSRNNLSGDIPSSMTQMNLLGYLDVSYNNLSGRIPSSTQLQSFEPSKYKGNAELCGLPLTRCCPGDGCSEVPPVVGESEDDEKEIDELWRWFYIGGATGFPIGFWIVCGTILLNRRARYAYFHFLESLHDMVYVKVAVFVAKLKRFVCK
ncbi:receptor-like protein EIX2 [Bidens hawaiensis]|uniref:receptor-like protein EIX2 n=1 Tax=Bidens hawaiensis TaxID=980011 RepID=UPI0040495F0D